MHFQGERSFIHSSSREDPVKLNPEQLVVSSFATVPAPEKVAANALATWACPTPATECFVCPAPTTPQDGC